MEAQWVKRVQSSNTGAEVKGYNGYSEHKGINLNGGKRGYGGVAGLKEYRDTGSHTPRLSYNPSHATIECPTTQVVRGLI